MTADPAASPPGTILDAVAAHAAERADDEAFLEKQLGRWVTYSWADLAERVQHLALGLRAEGIAPGDVVAILVKNSLTWLASDLAVQALGARSLALPPWSPRAYLEAVLTAARPRMVVAQEQHVVDAVLDLRDSEGLAGLSRIAYIEPQGVAEYDDAALVALDRVQRQGGEDARAGGETLASMRAERRADDIAVVNFTSGVTGPPRGALLTHGGLAAAASACREAFGLDQRDRVVTLRSMADPTERCTSVYPIIQAGGVLAFPESRRTAPQALYELAPTFVHVSPRMLTAPDELRVRLATTHGLKGLLARGFLRWEADAGRSGESLAGRVVRALYGYPVLEKVGLDKARLVVSGGPVPLQRLRFFRALGADIRPAYSLAEAGGVVLAGSAAGGAALRPLEGYEAEVGADGELLLRGDGLCAGYVDDGGVDRSRFDDEGRLRTSDLARAEPEGGITVLDRRAFVIELGDGQRVLPQPIETALQESSYIWEAVVAPGEDGLVARVEVLAASVGRWAQQRGLPFNTYTSLVHLEEVRDLIAGEVRRVSERLEEHERISEVLLVEQPFSLARGTINVSGKILRQAAMRAPAVPVEGRQAPSPTSLSGGSSPP